MVAHILQCSVTVREMNTHLFLCDHLCEKQAALIHYLENSTAR